jgi:hypothetical protein
LAEKVASFNRYKIKHISHAHLQMLSTPYISYIVFKNI